jgi:hypothetical protein
MAHKNPNGCHETTTTDTPPFLLLGKVTGRRTFADRLNDGDTFICRVQDADTDFEVFVATYNSGANSISRGAILDSSNSGSAVAWSGNPVKDITGTINGEQFASFTDEAQPLGFLPRTADYTYTARQMSTGTPTTVSWTNPAGTAGDPRIDVDAVPTGGGTFSGEVTFGAAANFSGLVDLQNTSTQILMPHFLESSAGEDGFRFTRNGATDFDFYVNQSATYKKALTTREMDLAGMTTGQVVIADSATQLLPVTAAVPEVLIDQAFAADDPFDMDLTAYDTYAYYRIVITGLVPGTDTDDLYMTISVNGSTFLGVGYDWDTRDDDGSDGASNASQFQLARTAQGLGAQTGEWYSCNLEIFPGDGTTPFHYNGNGQGVAKTGNYRTHYSLGGAMRQATSAVRATDIRLDASTGTLATGNIRLLGIR